MYNLVLIRTDKRSYIVRNNARWNSGSPLVEKPIIGDHLSGRHNNPLIYKFFMAKKVALKFGKHSRIDWKRNLNKMREAIKTDDQFQLQIYATIFTKFPKVVKEFYRREGITQEQLVCLVKDKSKIDGLKHLMPHIFAE